MIYKTIQPTSALQPFVERFIVYEASITGSLIQNRIPCNMQQIGFVLSGDIQANSIDTQTGTRSYVQGQLTKPLKVTYSGELKVVAIQFKPVGMYQLFGIPMYVFTDWLVDFESIVFSEGRSFIDAVFENTATEKKIEAIEIYLVNRIAKKRKDVCTRIEFAGNLILEQNGNMPIKEVASKVFMSERNLERHFIEQVGVSPKAFAGIARMKKAMEMIEYKPQWNWMDITYSLAYTDQAHFIHDFKKFANKTPTEYYNTRTDFEQFLYGR